MTGKAAKAGRAAHEFVVRRGTEAPLRPQGPPTWAERLGQWLFRHRTATFSPLAVAVVGGAVLAPASSGPTGPEAANATGSALGLLACAAAIRLHVAGRAKRGTSSRGVTFEAGELITTGMYAWVRNPLYLANLLIWCGLALLTGLPALALGVTVAAAAQYHFIVLAEERYLAGRYRGAYGRYRRGVPRWLPRMLAPGPARTAAPEFTWRRAIFREADTLFLLVLGAWSVGAVAWGWTPWRGAAQPPPFWPWLPAGPAVAWLVAKGLKKSRWKSRQPPG